MSRALGCSKVSPVACLMPLDLVESIPLAVGVLGPSILHWLVVRGNACFGVVDGHDPTSLRIRLARALLSPESFVGAGVGNPTSAMMLRRVFGVVTIFPHAYSSTMR